MPSKTRKHFSGLGEGRSNPIYTEPKVHDTAVLIPFFNPAPFKRILKNILYLIEVLKEKHIPYYVVECTFKKSKPQIPDATLVVNSDSYMFYKEQLLNKLEPLVPQRYTKLIFLDGDVLFDTPDWIDQTSASLEKNDMVQPFNEACWLTPDNTRIRSKKMSYASAIVTKQPITMRTMHNYHPGFAWGIKREMFHKIGGFFPRSIIGGGDVAFILNFFPIEVTDEIFFKAINGSFGKFIIDAWREYNKKFKQINPKLGFLYGRALHLFHGVKENRQYVTRYEDVSKVIKGDWDDEITTNPDGLFEFKTPAVSNTVLKYFKGRNEDIPISRAKRIIKQANIAAARRLTKKAKDTPKVEKNLRLDTTIVTLPS